MHANVGFHTHELVLQADLERLCIRGDQSLFDFRQGMLENAFVDSLLHDLEYPVLDDRVASDEAGARSHNFGDEVIGPERADHGVGGSFDQGCTDHGEGTEQGGVTVSDVGEGDGVIVAPGGEHGGHLDRCCDC